jgi:PTH1 family peptidyl-tRNA hydrolase
VGFRVVDVLRHTWRADETTERFGGRLTVARFLRAEEAAAAKVLLLEPQQYMNRSGEAVREAAAYYRVDSRDVLVVLDDMALPLGRLRVRPGGSAGGHNGLSDVLSALATEEVPRLRIGIGAAPASWDPADFVLARFRDEERETIDAAVQRAAEAVADWVFHGVAYAMNRYNREP